MAKPENVEEVLTRKTGAPFEIRNPALHDPFYDEHPVWFVMCPDVSYVEQTYFARAAWSDENNDLWIGSDILFTTAGLIDAVYGEDSDGLLSSSNLTSTEIDKELEARFPKVWSQIKAYDEVVAKVSSRLEVNVMIKRSGSDGIGYFTLVAKIDTKRVNHMTSVGLEDLIETSLRALKEAYAEIQKT
jgi:hypothetical protein